MGSVAYENNLHNVNINNFMWEKVKPIFNCDAKPLALGTFASPNAKDTNMLVSFALDNAIFSRYPTQNPNASQWNIGCIGYQKQFLVSSTALHKTDRRVRHTNVNGLYIGLNQLMWRHLEVAFRPVIKGMPCFEYLIIK